jgi:cation transport ATPase
MNIFQIKLFLFPFLYKKHNIIISDKEKIEILNNVDNHNDNIQQEYNKEKETINQILQKLDCDNNSSKEDMELNEKTKYYLNTIKNELENKKLDFANKEEIEKIINETSNHLVMKNNPLTALFLMAYMFFPVFIMIFLLAYFNSKNINPLMLLIIVFTPSLMIAGFFRLCEGLFPSLIKTEIDKLNHWTNYNKNNLLSHSKDEKTDFNKSNLNTLESDILFHMV